MDSGAFTRLTGEAGHLPVEVYAAEILRWRSAGQLLAAVSQDFMCEPFVLAKTGLTVADHQRLTIERYDSLCSALPEDSPYVLPVLQGFTPSEYVSHLAQYGDRIPAGAWVGVGSVCKRNANPLAVEAVLLAIATARPDLRLHGFGLKKTALASAIVWDILYSADSMAPSYHARLNPGKGESSNDPAVALAYAQSLTPPAQLSLWNSVHNPAPRKIASRPPLTS